MLDNKEGVDKSMDIIASLSKIRRDLLEIKETL